MNSRLMIHQVTRSLERLLAILALKRPLCLVNKPNVLLKCIEIRRLLPTIMTRIVPILRLVILHMPLVCLQLLNVMPANLTLKALLGMSCVSTRMLEQ